MQQNKIPSAYFREQKKYYTFDSFKKELGLQDAPQQIHTSGQRTILKEMKK